MSSSFMLRWSFVVGALLGVVGGMPAMSVRAETQTVSSVEVKQDEGVTRVVLRGARDPIYTAFMREDPPRLIVELPEVTFEGVTTPIEVGNGLVGQVTLGAFGDPRVSLSMARVSIALEQLAEYKLIPNGDQLTIEIRPSSVTTTVPKAAGDDAESASLPSSASEVDASEADPAVVADEAPAKLSSSSETAREATPNRVTEPKAKPASKSATPRGAGRATLTKIEADASSIDVHATGSISKVEAFTLGDPPRLVVDLFGAQRGGVGSELPVTEGPVRKVRVGAHPDKVRVVADLRDPKISHRVESTADGVRVWLTGDEDVVAQATAGESPSRDSEVMVPAPKPSTDVPAAPANNEFASRLESATASTPAHVTSAHFESLPEFDRVVVTMDRSVDAQLVSPDADTLIVRLPLATIERSVERRVDTREFGGPVEIFSVFQTPDVTPAEVRVVLKRRAGSEAKLAWGDGQLYVELPRTTPAGRVTPSDSAVELTGDASDSGRASVPASPAEPGTAETAGTALEPAPTDDPFQDPLAFAGPADPASIDILQEGGFDEEKEYIGRRVSLDFKDADIGNILRLIAEVSDLNVIAGEEVTGTVTIRLVDVPWDQALDVILLTKGLGFVRVGNVLRIAPLETIKLETAQRLEERRAKEKLEDLVVKLQPVNYADVDDVKNLVKRLLSKRGTVDIDQRTSTLIIKDIPSVVQEATALLKAIDTQTPQVLIEAKIVEANLSFSRSLGTVWALGYTPGQASSGNEDFSFGNDRDALIGDDIQSNNFVSSNPATGAISGLLTLGILSLDDRLQLDLQLQAAEANNKGKVISSPRVVTIDNKEAIIKQGVAIAFTETTTDRITTSFIDAVLELKVKPHITADRSIIMEIAVKKNAPQLSASTGAIAGIAKNETETEALVKDGETIVLGGIYVVDSGRQTQKVPFLADIPLIGPAFRSNSVSDERRELLIFVTPRVILGRPKDDV